MTKNEGIKMGEKDRQQSMGLEILKPDDTTLWKRALKAKPRRRAGQRGLVFRPDARLGILTMILDRLKKRRE
jgi:hypothetical protein